MRLVISLELLIRCLGKGKAEGRRRLIVLRIPLRIMNQTPTCYQIDLST